MLSEFCYRYNFAYYFTFIKYLALEFNHVYDVKLLLLQENLLIAEFIINRGLYTGFYAKVSFTFNRNCFPYISFDISD